MAIIVHRKVQVQRQLRRREMGLAHSALSLSSEGHAR